MLPRDRVRMPLLAERRGQTNRENCPRSGTAANLDPASVLGHDPPALRQPHADAAASLPAE